MAVRPATAPAITNDQITAGPATGTACESTKKMPVPMVAPTPNIESWKSPIERVSSLWPVSVPVSADISGTGLRRKSCSTVGMYASQSGNVEGSVSPPCSGVLHIGVPGEQDLVGARRRLAQGRPCAGGQPAALGFRMDSPGWPAVQAPSRKADRGGGPRSAKLVSLRAPRHTPWWRHLGRAQVRRAVCAHIVPQPGADECREDRAQADRLRMVPAALVRARRPP